VEKLSLTGKTQHSSDDSLKGLSAVFVDGDRVFIDNGAIHGKSQLEKNITFVKSKDELQNPREVWAFWITLKRFDGVQGFFGAMPYVLLIDDTARQGYKSLAEQVNKMEKAVKGQVDLTGVPEAVRSRVREFLVRVRPDLWEHAAPAFRAALTE
jgi:hypothetical protein